MRNRILLVLGIASLISAPVAHAAIVRQWDSTQNKWVTFDTKSPKYFQGSGKSAIPKEFISYEGPYGPNTIVVNTAERRLYLIYAPGKAIKYGIGVGREGFTWSGVDRVSMKAEWPGWTPPPEMIKREKAKGRILPAYMPGGLNNPLGARALYIGARIYRIHGSNEPWTIGHAVSSGCIRLTNDDIIDLYNRVPVGTRVVVLSESGEVASAGPDTAVESDASVLPKKPLVPSKSAAADKPIAKARLPVKAPATAVVAVKAPANENDEGVPAKPKAVIVAKKVPPVIVPDRPTKDDDAAASFAPQPAPAPKAEIMARASGDGIVGGGNAGEVTGAIKVPPPAPKAKKELPTFSVQF